ncbi:hypothetical protein ACLB2K_058666 [Fragaria x ananassa]
MKRAELVFIPTPSTGHLVSTIEFSKRLLDRCDQFSVTILLMKSPFGVATDQSLPAASNTNIKLIHLPNINPPIKLDSVEKFLTDYIETYKHHVKDTILNQVLPNSSRIAGVVIDMFCTTMIDIADEIKVPSFLFFTSGAAFLGLLLYLPKRYDLVGKEFVHSDPDSIVPSYVNPVPTNVLPGFVFNNGGYVSFASHARRFKETKGLIINTLVELESHAIHSIFKVAEGDQSDQPWPAVYPVGPLIDTKGEHQVRSDRDSIMEFLDDQPPKSVVFLCFGSFGSFDEAQLKEIAIGLEKSGHRFLWSVRRRPPKGKTEFPGEYKNYEDFLPQGFLERTKGVGMLCGWAPQVEVLGHKATGGFVSHCGWNSILESLWYGVPIVTWPLYAEQQVNAFLIARDLGLGVELRLDYVYGSGDFVSADEIERAVTGLMDGDSEIRKRVVEMSEMCRRAVDDGGSSSTSLGSLIKRAEPVFVPTPAVGHLVSAIEFAIRLLDQCHRFSVTILVMKSPFGVTGDQSLPAASHTHIKFIHLPNVDPPTELVSAEKYLTDYIENYKSHVRNTIFNRVLPNTSQVAGMVVDMFCTTMIDMANELKVPSFIFFTSGAAYLDLLLYLPKRDCESIIPSYIHPVPTNALPAFAFNYGGYKSFVNHARRFMETKGIIVNTFVELESHAVHSLFDGNENDQSKLHPQVYTIGPLIDIKGRYQVQSNQTKVDKIMTWLDDQPPKSVVFLCFGSSGSFDENQLKEMAIGEYTNYEEFLPRDFSKRTKGIGMLCGWAPQAEVLGHKAIGGATDQCISNGEGFGIGGGVVYKKDGGDFVTADEIERALRRLMEEGDGDIRKRVQ